MAENQRIKAFGTNIKRSARALDSNKIRNRRRAANTYVVITDAHFIDVIVGRARSHLLSVSGANRREGGGEQPARITIYVVVCTAFSREKAETDLGSFAHSPNSLFDEVHTLAFGMRACIHITPHQFWNISILLCALCSVKIQLEPSLSRKAISNGDNTASNGVTIARTIE